MIYGYCRISKPTQRLERQQHNITSIYPDAKIFSEAYTGTKVEGRKEFNRLLKTVNAGDTIVFDSVSRMSRNAQEGMEQYFHLHDAGVNLVFIKEPYINTQVFDESINRALHSSVKVETGNAATDKFTNAILNALTEFQMDLARNQIQIAFDQAEKEVTDLQQRTKEGIDRVKANGGLVGGAAHKSKTLHIKGKDEKKAEIRKKSKSFGGSINDKDLMKILSISNNTYYKYKKEVLEEITSEQNS